MKSIIITYNEADENILMGIFKKFKVKTIPISEKVETTEQLVAVEEHDILQNIKTGYIEAQKGIKGANSLDDLLNLLEDGDYTNPSVR